MNNDEPWKDKNVTVSNCADTISCCTFVDMLKEAKKARGSMAFQTIDMGYQINRPRELTRKDTKKGAYPYGKMSARMVQ